MDLSAGSNSEEKRVRHNGHRQFIADNGYDDEPFLPLLGFLVRRLRLATSFCLRPRSRIFCVEARCVSPVKCAVSSRTVGYLKRSAMATSFLKSSRSLLWTLTIKSEW